jgi:hypothetical protein
MKNLKRAVDMNNVRKFDKNDIGVKGDIFVEVDNIYYLMDDNVEVGCVVLTNDNILKQISVEDISYYIENNLFIKRVIGTTNSLNMFNIPLFEIENGDNIEDITCKFFEKENGYSILTTHNHNAHMRYSDIRNIVSFVLMDNIGAVYVLCDKESNPIIKDGFLEICDVV